MKELKILKKYITPKKYPGDRILIKDRKIVFTDDCFLLIYPLETEKEEGIYLVNNKFEIKEKTEEYPDFKSVRICFTKEPDILRISLSVINYGASMHLLECLIYALTEYHSFYVNKKYFPLLSWFLTTNYKEDTEIRVKIKKIKKDRPCALFYVLQKRERQKELYLMPLRLELKRLRIKNKKLKRG